MNKNTNIGMRVTNSFKASLEMSAKKEGLSVAQYTRRKLLKNEIETINGLLLHYEAITLVKDTIVYLLDYKGRKVKPADADYILTDGKAISVRNGMVSNPNVKMTDAELSQKILFTENLKSVKNTLEQVFLNLGIESINNRSKEFKATVTLQKNKASKGSVIEQVLALSKTLELMTNKPNRNVNDVIRKLKNG
ncbi:hypothetical protein N9P25_02555 [Flavobacteriaceae bacterium]|nr:hypothetical protein [Flavobacteriaceae bacterium]